MEITGTVEIMNARFRRVKRKVGKCVCGETMTLTDFTNACRCGRDYNMSGQLLAPRSQWGEETGEHWSDIVSGWD